MTCYTFESETWIKPVKSIRYNGRRISNPPDELVIKAGMGYPLQTTEQPEYNPETQYINKSYKLENGVIIEVWTVIDIPQPEPEPEPEPETSDSSSSDSDSDSSEQSEATE